MRRSRAGRAVPRVRGAGGRLGHGAAGDAEPGCRLGERDRQQHRDRRRPYDKLPSGDALANAVSTVTILLMAGGHGVKALSKRHDYASILCPGDALTANWSWFGGLVQEEIVAGTAPVRQPLPENEVAVDAAVLADKARCWHEKPARNTIAVLAIALLIIPWMCVLNTGRDPPQGACCYSPERSIRSSSRTITADRGTMTAQSLTLKRRGRVRSPNWPRFRMPSRARG